jgi:hypothetical protein
MRLVTVVYFAVSCAFGATPADTQPWVFQTGCDSVVIETRAYPRASFQVQNADLTRAICVMVMLPRPAPQPSDTCRAIQCFAPPGWDCAVQADGSVFWAGTSDPAEPCILPGQTLSGFGVVLTQATPCSYDAFLSGVFPEPFGIQEVNFECDLAVSTNATTWGRLKTIYRL